MPRHGHIPANVTPVVPKAEPADIYGTDRVIIQLHPYDPCPNCLKIYSIHPSIRLLSPSTL